MRSTPLSRLYNIVAPAGVVICSDTSSADPSQAYVFVFGLACKLQTTFLVGEPNTLPVVCYGYECQKADICDATGQLRENLDLKTILTGGMFVGTTTRVCKRGFFNMAEGVAPKEMRPSPRYMTAESLRAWDNFRTNQEIVTNPEKILFLMSGQEGDLQLPPEFKAQRAYQNLYEREAKYSASHSQAAYKKWYQLLFKNIGTFLTGASAKGILNYSKGLDGMYNFSMPPEAEACVDVILGRLFQLRSESSEVIRDISALYSVSLVDLDNYNRDGQIESGFIYFRKMWKEWLDGNHKLEVSGKLSLMGIKKLMNGVFNPMNRGAANIAANGVFAGAAVPAGEIIAPAIGGIGTAINAPATVVGGIGTALNGIGSVASRVGIGSISSAATSVTGASTSMTSTLSVASNPVTAVGTLLSGPGATIPGLGLTFNAGGPVGIAGDVLNLLIAEAQRMQLEGWQKLFLSNLNRVVDGLTQNIHDESRPQEERDQALEMKGVLWRLRKGGRPINPKAGFLSNDVANNVLHQDIRAPQVETRPTARFMRNHLSHNMLQKNKMLAEVLSWFVLKEGRRLDNAELAVTMAKLKLAIGGITALCTVGAVQEGGTIAGGVLSVGKLLSKGYCMRANTETMNLYKVQIDQEIARYNAEKSEASTNPLNELANKISFDRNNEAEIEICDAAIDRQFVLMAKEFKSIKHLGHLTVGDYMRTRIGYYIVEGAAASLLMTREPTQSEQVYFKMIQCLALYYNYRMSAKLTTWLRAGMPGGTFGKVFMDEVQNLVGTIPNY